MAEADAPTLRALVVDYGGVLTTSLDTSTRDWIAADGLDPELVRTAMRTIIADSYGKGDGMIHGLETGRIPAAEFERQLAHELAQAGVSDVDPEGLLGRMFAGMREETGMTGALLRARAAGFKTALLSNSWGNEYPRERWHELFDETVISGEVGMRKPEPEIYRLVAERLGVTPEECVFVDDIATNIRGAVAVGMVGVHHTDVDATLAELEVLLGIPMRGPS
ncbi:MAG TPA: HAD family phosphatase [Mycobacteriales bacterium]|nr:HAD family phosphatase [Mycobacteriales bacterium]